MNDVTNKTKPAYDELVFALRKVKSNGTRLRWDTRDLVRELLAKVDDDGGLVRPFGFNKDKWAAMSREEKEKLQ